MIADLSTDSRVRVTRSKLTFSPNPALYSISLLRLADWAFIRRPR
jgi:hypothetical protein